MAMEPFGVLKHLNAISPNQIYFLAPKAVVMRGYEYYAQGRLEAYSWDRTRTALSAIVRGSLRYTIRLMADDGMLAYTCNCPAWTQTDQCKHVICVLLTSVNLLNPDTFRMSHRSNISRRDLLERQLLAGGKATSASMPSLPIPAQFEVTLGTREGRGEVMITNHGVMCQSVLGMPAELALLQRSIQDPAWSTQEGLQNFLNHHGHRHPLFVETAEERIPVEWTPSTIYTTKTELNLVGQTVTITARCVRYGEMLESVHTIMGFVVDMTTHRLSPLEYEGGWQIFDLLYDQGRRAGFIRHQDLLNSPLTYSKDPIAPGMHGGRSGDKRQNEARAPFTIPVQDFLQLQCDIPLPDKTRIFYGIALKVDGKDVPVPEPMELDQQSGYDYRLTLVRAKRASGDFLADQETAVLRAECWLGDSRTSPSAALFSVFPFMNQSTAVSSGLKARKRRTLLYDTLLTLWCLKKSADVRKTIKACLAHEEFGAFKLRAEADTLLHRFSEPALIPSFRLAIDRGQWCLIPNDRARETALYAIPYRLFGSQIFEEMHTHDEMRVTPGTLYPLLPELFALAKEAGLTLYFQDAPIVTSQWECSVDARRSSAIDWFELHPEIMCDGVRIEAKDLEKILQQGGLLTSDGGLRIIDPQTQAMLRALSSLTGKPQAKPGVWDKKIIVQVPKLQILDWVALRRQGVTVHLPPEDEALIDRLLHFERIEPIPLPQRLRATLRHYQEEGYHWLAFLYRHRLGACLADDMGLGKTLQAMSVLAGIKEGIITAPERLQGPHLVVLPPSLLFNWEHEIKRFYPDLMVQSYTGKERTTAFSEADVVLTTYGLVRRDIDVLEKTRFNVIVFDEAQAVKNIVARTTGAARRLKGYFKCVMTGTPLENHVGEYYSLMDLCVPGLLGDYEEMKGKMKAPTPLVLDMIMQRTRPFVLRRTKTQILKELPAKVETDIYLELSDRQKVLYQQTVATIRTTIAAAYQTKTSAQARVIALTAILKLRQICLTPRLINAASAEQSPKLLCLLDRLRELIEEGHSALVFSQFTSFLDVVEEAFGAHGIPYVRLDGSTPTLHRKKLVQTFQEGSAPSVFLLSLKAGGQGLNLTKASYVFHLDPWWNPAVENQASDRAHRIGQNRKVSIMRLLMRHTIEEKMMELKQKKLELYHAVLEGAAHHGGGTGLSQKDFEFLLE
ncbi:MAG: DEAD/DEAH box helicase [Nitrospirales bacterium]|nr:DEAD/DEAH box helicase [Nitrospirales bacterium]